MNKKLGRIVALLTLVVLLSFSTATSVEAGNVMTPTSRDVKISATASSVGHVGYTYVVTVVIENGDTETGVNVNANLPPGNLDQFEQEQSRIGTFNITDNDDGPDLVQWLTTFTGDSFPLEPYEVVTLTLRTHLEEVGKWTLEHSVQTWAFLDPNPGNNFAYVTTKVDIYNPVCWIYMPITIK